MIIDDYEPWRRYLSSWLEKKHFDVVGQASDGLEGIQKAEELQPDVVLLDLSLHTLNGIDAAKIIRETRPKSRIVFLTQNPDSEVRDAAMSTGASGYVIKSNTGQELLAAIAAALRDY